MTSRTLADARSWVATGTASINAHLDTLSEADFTAASGLPGWSRKHLVAHTETEGPALELTDTDSPLKWQVAGAGAPTVVSGSLPALAAYLSGRSSGLVVAVGGAVPELPAWL